VAELSAVADSLEGWNLGKYRVLEPLGRGGMARVYRAYHPQLDRYVAMKVLRSDLVEEEEFLARFRREARAVAALRHPNIVQVFDFDVRNGLYYMVMELMESDSLRTRLNDYRLRDERMPLGEIVRVLLDVLDGLGYAHSEGMVHRDVKPANILLSRRGQAVLTDFGIAHIIGGTRYTVSGALMGTLAYMSPEQGLEGQCDARSDIYSLGIVFYEMLLGDVPFDAETPLAILMKHVNDPLPPPRRSDPSIPKPLERVVLKSLAKRPGDRYRCAGEMGEALEKAARRAKIEVPGRVSLPLSFTTPDAPSESVAVLSGTDRDKVQTTDFAREDTDASLGEKLAEEVAASQAAPAAPDAAPAVPNRVDGKLGIAAGSAAVASAPFARAHAEPAEPASAVKADPAPAIKAPAGAKPGERGRVGEAILKAVGIVALGNMLVIFLGVFTGRWGTFGRGWPFELLLIGLGLSVIMEATGSIWMLIPTGIILGNGFLFAFYALTNAWGLWAFLWPLEPLLVGGTVFITIWLANRTEKEESSRMARHLARVLWRPTLILIALVVVVGAIFGS
jgi:serine/threonine-protein kinase